MRALRLERPPKRCGEPGKRLRSLPQPSRWRLHRARRIAFDLGPGGRRIDADEAIGRCLHAREIAGAHPFEEGEVLGLETVGGAGFGAPLRRDLRLEVEPEREIGLQALLDGELEAPEQREIQAAAEALVGEGGIGETIAEHDLAPPQRRRDDALDVIAARGEDEQGFGERRPSAAAGSSRASAPPAAFRRARALP